MAGSSGHKGLFSAGSGLFSWLPGEITALQQSLSASETLNCGAPGLPSPTSTSPPLPHKPLPSLGTGEAAFLGFTKLN